MSSSPLFWFLLNLGSIILLSFYSMMEMACVSLNKIRLQYYVNTGNRHAEKLNFLMKNSTRLFGTTLIGVSLATMLGSEFARQFNTSIGISPDLAPLTQVMIVIIFGELAPMFAARRYPEHTAMLGANILYASAQVMRPFLWLLGLLTKIVNYFFTGDERSEKAFLNREDIKNVLGGREEETPAASSAEEFDMIISNIFTLRGKTAGKVMNPLQTLTMMAATHTVKEMRIALQASGQPFVLVYHRRPSNIVGIALPRDMLRAPDNHRLTEYTRHPWFISKEMELVHIMHSFRRNKQSAAVVLDAKGHAVGVLTFQDIIDEIFTLEALKEENSSKKTPLIERTFPGDMRISEFNKMFNVNLEDQGCETLAELVIKVIGHHPEKGESILLAPFELEVKDANLLEVKLVTVKTMLT